MKVYLAIFFHLRGLGKDSFPRLDFGQYYVIDAMNDSETT
jgi:hypothetical protein